MIQQAERKQIEREVGSYIANKKEMERIGRKTSLYNGLGKVMFTYISAVSREDLKIYIKDKGLPEYVEGVIKEDLAKLAKNSYDKGLKDNEFSELTGQYEDEYIDYLYDRVVSLHREDRKRVNVIFQERPIASGNYETEYMHIVEKVKGIIPEFVYLRYLTGEYLYQIAEGNHRPEFEGVEEFVEGVEWYIKNKTNWIRERTEEYYHYAIIIGQDPRLKSISSEKSRGLDMRRLDIWLKSTIYRDDELMGRIKGQYTRKEQDFERKVINRNRQLEQNNVLELLVSESEISRLYLATLVVKNTELIRKFKTVKTPRNVEETKVSRNLREKLIKYKILIEGYGSVDYMLGHTEQMLNRMGASVITIKDKTFILGNRLIVLKGKEGIREVIYENSNSNVREVEIQKLIQI